MEDRNIGRLITVFERMSTQNDSVWFLDKKCLLEFAINNRIIDKPQIGIIKCKDEVFEERCKNFRIKTHQDEKCNYYTKYSVYLEEQPIEVNIYRGLKKGLISAPDDVIEKENKRIMKMSKQGTWRFQISHDKWYNPPIPYKFGSVMDIELPNWIARVKHIRKFNPDSESWISGKRAENALELMSLLMECATTAKIDKYFFVGFGTLLGIARDGDFIASDRDMDHCVQSEFVTMDTEEIFLKEVAKARTIKGKSYPKGLYEGRKVVPLRRRDTTRFIWTSCGHKRPKGQKGIKSCIWSWFKHDGYDWHCKGRLWVGKKIRRSIQINESEDAIAKGMTTGHLDKFIEINFKGIRINVPKNTGSFLDEWYPGWKMPKKGKEGKSSEEHLLIIPSWKNKNTWKMV